MEKNITDFPTSETEGKDTVYFVKEDEAKVIEKSEEVKSGNSELDKDNRIFEGGENVDVPSLSEEGLKHDDSGKTEAGMDLESVSRGTTLSNDIDQVDQGKQMDDENNIKSKVEENCGDSIKHNELGEINSSMNLDSNSQKELLSNEVEQGEKMDAEHILNSKVVEETKQSTTENRGENIKHDVLDEVESSAELKHKFKQGTARNNNEKVEEVEKMDGGNNLEFKPDEQTEETTSDKYGDNIRNDDLREMDRVVDVKSPSSQGSLSNDIGQVDQKTMESKPEEYGKQMLEENHGEESYPILDGGNVPVVETKRCISFSSLGADTRNEEPVRPEKGKKLRDFVKSKSVVAVTSFMRAVSGKFTSDEEKNASDLANDREATKARPKPGDSSAWNPLSFIIRNNDAGNRNGQGEEDSAQAPEPLITKGRVILYTRLGCQICNEVRLFLYNKRLRYVEINIDVYPSRKQELEMFTGSCIVPKVFFNEVDIGGLSELKSLDKSGKLKEKIDHLITEEPSEEAPLPPFSGEDDAASTGPTDEWALIVRKMKESIVVKDRFYKLRRFSRCFLGTDAIDFLSKDLILEKEEAIEFGRNLASKLFFQHVLQENLFEDGNHLYWFLDDNPNVSSQCHNIPRGISEVKQKPIRDIASRLRFLSNAIYEAYLSEDGKHVDYRTIHGSEEFARYLRIIQELQRAEFQNMHREEKLAFFINVYNMMTFHAILVLGHPNGPAERRQLLGDFKYVIGGSSYSISDIQNGILRCNQRLPYTLTKPFGVDDKRAKLCLPYPEPLIHFALVLGTRSGPALRCYSPGNIDKELMDSARSFLRGGGLIVDLDAKVAYVSKILKWFSVDFGKTEVEILKHVSNYLEPANSEALLELLANGQLKVTYQRYDWGLNL
ncbi:electron carriers protein disulfide oxidoreductase [Euphorbia peplus]|nr:electron carriers protein disulfide oxidoreductase [Euphorbia peplus]